VERRNRLVLEGHRLAEDGTAAQ